MLPVRKSRSYQWNEIADWGISYLFSDRFGVQYNGIYFSDRILPIDTKNDKRKKAYHSILLSFEEYDYNRVKTEVMPYIMQHTQVLPFDGVTE